MQKQLLSFAAILAFLILAVASSGVNKMKTNSFVTDEKVENSKEGNYVLKIDGTKIHGKKVEYGSGLFAKDEVRLDDQHFPLKEIKGFMKDDAFYIKRNNVFIRRIVHGKINVYVLFKEFSDNSGGMHTTTTVADYFAQEGEDGELKAFGGQKQLKQLLQSCPQAVAMIDISDKELRNAIKDDSRYMNKVFELYNNGCKPVKK